jgi:NAD(P)-dependent dehydrogenase (short-subunit alcohol dehydrogenase family)
LVLLSFTYTNASLWSKLTMKIADVFKVEGYGVIVTGGASGLGLGFTEVLVANGARVTMLDADSQRLEAETQRLRAAGFDVMGVCVDVTDHPALDKAFADAVRAYGRVDVVFANAGIDPGAGFMGGWGGSKAIREPAGALEVYTDERWNRVIEINLNGVFATVRAAARHMKPQGSGHIIVTTSLASTQVEGVIGSAYMAAKAGAAHFMRCAALELAAYNITVNAIAPGIFVTNIGGGHSKNPALQKALAKVIPMHRVALPDDIKGLALFLASPASNYVTGQEIVIDGGLGLGTAD